MFLKKKFFSNTDTIILNQTRLKLKQSTKPLQISSTPFST